MQWPEFAHAVRAAGAILGEDLVVVIGSQSVLAWFDDLPPQTTMSRAIDIAALDDPDGSKSHILAGAIGEGSPFDAAFGFHVDGVSLGTPLAPRGWLDRCRAVSTPAMNGVTALCMEPHDLCAAKLLAGRQKDTTFVQALLTSGLVDRGTIEDRLDQTGAPVRQIQQARAALQAL